MQEQHMAGLGYERNIYNYRGPGRSGQDHTEGAALGISGEERL